MTARVAALSADERTRGIITVSAGNAAQGYAWAGAALGVPVTVVMPAAANRSKAQAAAGYGARVVLEGDRMEQTFAAVDRIRDEEGLVFCHPFDDRHVVAGHGSAGLELVEDLPDVDVVVVGIGGGGLISGIAAAVLGRAPQARIVGVEPETSNALSQAIEAGQARPDPAAIDRRWPERPLRRRAHPGDGQGARRGGRPDRRRHDPRSASASRPSDSSRSSSRRGPPRWPRRCPDGSGCVMARPSRSCSPAGTSTSRRSGI